MVSDWSRHVGDLWEVLFRQQIERAEIYSAYPCLRRASSLTISFKMFIMNPVKELKDWKGQTGTQMTETTGREQVSCYLVV